MTRGLYVGNDGATITFRHPDGRVRSDFAMGSPTEAVLSLLRSYPEPWKVVSISHPQTILSDLNQRMPAGEGRRRVQIPEGPILRSLGAKGRLA